MTPSKHSLTDAITLPIYSSHTQLSVRLLQLVIQLQSILVNFTDRLARISPLRLSARGALVVGISSAALFFYAIPGFDLVAGIGASAALGFSLLFFALNLVFGVLLLKKSTLSVSASPPVTAPHNELSLAFTMQNVFIPPFFYLRTVLEFKYNALLDDYSNATSLTYSHLSPTLPISSCWRVAFPHRGKWLVENVRFSLEDRLGLTRFSWKRPVVVEIPVYATPVPNSNLPIFVSETSWGEDTAPDSTPSGDWFDVKAYDPSDGTSKILWKTYARSGQLYVRRQETATSPTGTVALFVIANRTDDYLAGVAESYVNNLLIQEISVLVSTDGAQHLLHLQPRARLNADAWSLGCDRREVADLLASSALSPKAGSGVGIQQFAKQLSDWGPNLKITVLASKPTSGEINDQIRMVQANHKVEIITVSQP